MDILGFYAQGGNRELYWNYLAQHEGSDGYGLLALGVVRNDSMPGSVANNFARNHARSHDDRVLGEREREKFGQDLITYVLEQRKYWMEQHRPALALNLTCKEIQTHHDPSSKKAPLHHNPWPPTPIP